MKSIISISLLGLAFSSLTLTSYADQGHASEMGHTAVEHHRMKTEDNGPSSNEWITQSSEAHDEKAYKSASKMGHTAVQHSRMKTEVNGPNPNDWSNDQPSQTAKSAPSATHMGHTAVQHRRMQTEDNGPNSNNWVSR